MSDKDKNKLAELIVNGGFETGAQPPWTIEGGFASVSNTPSAYSGALPPWTVVAGSASVSNTRRAHSGNFVAAIGNSSAIQQVISSGIKDKRVYQLSGALASDGTGIGLPENPTTVVTLQFTDKIGNILQTFAKTFNRLTLPGQNEGNYRVFTLLAAAPVNSSGAIVTIATTADSGATPGIVADDFSLI